MLPHAGEAPSPWIVRFAPLVRAGAHVLDLACGSGRHTRLFVERGCRVTAVDRVPALDGWLTAQRTVTVVTADLELGRWPFGSERFDAIVVTNYLHRPLFAHLVAALAPCGLLLYETFAAGNAAFGKPSNPDFLLSPRELLTSLAAELRVIAFEDGYIETPRRAMVQRLAARAADASTAFEPQQLALMAS
jgi:SAM-dependent methyltransferase